MSISSFAAHIIAICTEKQKCDYCGHLTRYAAGHHGPTCTECGEPYWFTTRSGYIGKAETGIKCVEPEQWGTELDLAKAHGAVPYMGNKHRACE